MPATPNERLRTAMLRTGTTIDDLALCCGVDPKTVERWLSLGRVPHRANRWDAARRLGYDEDYLWPDAPGRDRSRQLEASQSELVRLYPDRGSIPRETWHQLFGGAREEIAVLVYAALWLAEDAGTRRLLADQARAGVRVRLLFGDPDCAAVAQRGEQEGIGAVSIGAKIRNVLALFRPLAEAGLAEVRLHDTVLYNSLYQADDQVLVNSHLYGNVASNAPVLHLRKVSGGSMVALYLDCYTRIWDAAKTVERGRRVNRKIDYHDDPAAPEPNSLVPAVTVIVARQDGAILLIRRTDNANWALPGGAIEMLESVADATIRETREETGVKVEVTGLAGVYSDPRHVIHYTSNDEVRREFSIVVTARPVSGDLTPSAESREVRWVLPAELGGYAMDRSMRKRVTNYLEHPGTPTVA